MHAAGAGPARHFFRAVWRLFGPLTLSPIGPDPKKPMALPWICHTRRLECRFLETLEGKSWRPPTRYIYKYAEPGKWRWTPNITDSCVGKFLFESIILRVHVCFREWMYCQLSRYMWDICSEGVMQVGCGGEVVFDDADDAHPGHHFGMSFLKKKLLICDLSYLLLLKLD